MRIGEVLTMAEYIEREALMRQIKEIHCAECNSYHGVRCRACWVDDALGYIDSEPTADVAPVRHARWDENGRCSNCGGHAPFWCMASTYYKSPWCQECGAKMDLEG